MDIKRIVIKIGTSTITHNKGLINKNLMQAIVRVVSNIKKESKEVVIVSSGAVGIGSSKLNFSAPPKEVPIRQACASIGQYALMNLYDELFSKYCYIVSQILLPQNVLDGGTNEMNTKNTFKELLKRGIVPIVNANDTISTKEIEFGDNDSLSAAVAVLIDADILIILTDTDGIYDKNPNKNKDAKLIKTIYDIDSKVENAAGGEGNLFGTGGMKTKLNSAKTVSIKAIPTVILNGAYPDRIAGVFEGKVEGTLIDLKRNFFIKNKV